MRIECEGRVYLGEVLECLREMPDEHFQMVCTSPPYFQLRDYNHPGQIGMEATPEAFVDRLVEVFREVRRVLRPDGTLWVNMGDTLCGGGRGGSIGESMQKTNHGSLRLNRQTPPSGLKTKDLMGIPWMLAFALRADGWYLRSDIVWQKPNGMPESVRDRPSKSHEYVFLLTKRANYYYDADAIAEPLVTVEKRSKRVVYEGKSVATSTFMPPRADGMKNRRSVWKIPTESYQGAHFAVWPRRLVALMVRAGTSEWGACPNCGAPWKRCVENVTTYEGNSARAGRSIEAINGSGKWAGVGKGNVGLKSGPVAHRTNVGWMMTCKCPEHPTVPCRVLDPFGGSGTTVEVALSLGREGTMIELQEDYLPLVEERIERGIKQRPRIVVKRTAPLVRRPMIRARR